MQYVRYVQLKYGNAFVVFNSSYLENAFPHKNNSKKSNAKDFLCLVLQKILILMVLNIVLYHFWGGSSTQQLG